MFAEPLAHEVVLSVPPESETAPPLVEMVEVVAVLIPPPRLVAASVSDQRVTAPPAVVMLLLAKMSVAALTVKPLPEPVIVWLAFRVTEPPVEANVAAPGELQALGKVMLFAVVTETVPVAEDSVVRLLKVSPLVDAVLDIVIEPLPVVETELFVVAK